MKKIIIIATAVVALLCAGIGTAVALTSSPDNAAACRTSVEKLYVQLMAGEHPSAAEPASCKALPEKVRVQMAYDVLHGRNG